MSLLIESSDELRDLDGFSGRRPGARSPQARAEIDASAPCQTRPSPDVARTCAKSLRDANPSTMALVARRTAAGSKVWVGCEDVTRRKRAVHRTAANTLQSQVETRRSTRWCPPIHSTDSLAANRGRFGRTRGGGPRQARSSSAAAVVAQGLQSQRGRASWLQDRSIGLQGSRRDRLLRALEAWRDAATGEGGLRAAVVVPLGRGIMRPSLRLGANSPITSRPSPATTQRGSHRACSIPDRSCPNKLGSLRQTPCFVNNSSG